MTVYYVDSAATGANDGSSEANAWTTIDAAMNTVAAGDKVWVKASGTYDETATIDTAGAVGNPIVFEGYTTTTGDLGQVTWTKSTSGDCLGRIAGASYFYIFKNFHFSNAAGFGADLGGASYFVFFNCEFTGCGQSGCQCAGNVYWINCEAHNNSLNGMYIDQGNGVAIGCISSGNGTAQIVLYGAESIGYRNVAYDGGNNAGQRMLWVETAFANTLDGENAANQVLIGAPGTGTRGIYVDNIIYDANIGVQFETGSLMNGFAGWNLLNSNTDDYANDVAEVHFKPGDVSGAPAFTDEANDDYTLGTSPADDAGMQPGTV